MKRLIIIGAGGFGREVYVYARDVQAKCKEWEIAGFLDENPKALDGLKYDIPILGGIKDYMPQSGDGFVMGIGSPTKNKLEIARLFLNKSARFINLIHPSAIIGNNVTIGQGCILSPFATITCDIVVGDFVSMNVNSGIGHDAKIGDGCTLSSYAVVSGWGQLGKGVYMGAHSCILQGVKVMDFAKIGAGSVVVKNVKPGTTVMGVPAKMI